MRLILTIVFIFSLITLNAQDKVIVKYYDTLFRVVSKENAAYYYEYEYRDSFYSCTAYYYPSNKLYSKFMTLGPGANMSVRLVSTYYESGNIKDSVFYYQQGRPTYEYHFYENGNKKKVSIYGKGFGTFETRAFYESGKLWAYVYKKNPFDKIECDAFDEAGKPMPDYIYERPAEFQGGITQWQYYIMRNLNRDIPYDKKAPKGKYTVYVTFVINKDGRVTDVAAENDPGYGTKEEAERVIRNGPKWNPAIQFNTPVIYRNKQGITFVVSDQR
jgi:hypothetical protein